MTAGLPLSDVVSVSVTLEPSAVSTRNFGAMLYLGASTVLSATETMRKYASSEAVGTDFTVTSDEYYASQAYFSQSPQPSTLYVGAKQASETWAAAALRMVQQSADWYCMILPPLTSAVGITAADVLAVAQVIEAASQSRILGVTDVGTDVLNSADEAASLAYEISQANLARTFTQAVPMASGAATSSAAFAAASIFGRNATVDYTANNSVITLKFKNEPGQTALTITETQRAYLDSIDCNYFVNYQNGTAIIQQGVMANGDYIDERIGLDSFQNDLQVSGFNALYGATKIPQTDAGMTTLMSTYNGTCEQYVTNGLFAAGVWTGPNIGSLKTGDTMPDGYYIYKPLVASQSAGDRRARKAVTMQIACKLAGAVHSSNVLVSVVR